MNFFRNLFGKAQEDVSAPSVDDLEEAKKIFFEYSCNRNHIAREGPDYKKYRISKEQEIEWRKEFIAHWTNKFAVGDLTTVTKLSAADALEIESVPDLLGIAENGDSYAKVIIAGAIQSLGWKDGIDKNLRKQTLDIASKLLESIVEGQVQLSEDHPNRILLSEFCLCPPTRK